MASKVVDRVWESGPCQWGRDHLPLVQRGIDASAWLLAVPVSTFLRYDGHFEPMNPAWIALFATLGATAQLVTGQIFGLYHRRWRYGSFDELMAVAISALTASLLLLTLRVVIHSHSVPRSVPLIAGVLALMVMCLVRYLWRSLSETSNRPR